MNRALTTWVDEVAAHTKPDDVHWCDGSRVESVAIEDHMIASGSLVRLDTLRCPNSFIYRTDPADVARSEHRSFVCTPDVADAGPTNNWVGPAEAARTIWPLFAGAMRKRTMYVVPYLLGPASRSRHVGVQLTDCPYVVLSLRILTRMGDVALRQLGVGRAFVKGLHSLGDRSPTRRFVCHFPHSRTIWSIGSGHGDNAILSRKCHALRIGSVLAHDEGWMAEHMAIVGVTSPNGVRHYVAAAFPSGCGKTTLAMLAPSLPNWKVETVSNDVCWIRVGDDGRLWAVNPEAGFVGAASGTSKRTNPNALMALLRGVLFTNVAMREDATPWWEGLEQVKDGETLTDWRGKPWRRGDSEAAAHPSSCFTLAARQCPTVGASFDEAKGVPISAIVFGGRRSRLAPLVYEAQNWAHGVYVGATLVSETIGSAAGAEAVMRNDPMAMLPYCSYNMGDYFGHWLAIGKRLSRPPKIFHVNWFRAGDDGRLLWPGFGENIRVLKWILDRVIDTPGARSTAIGKVPTRDSFDLVGLDLGPDRFEELMAVDPKAWAVEAHGNGAFLDLFGNRLPNALLREHLSLLDRLHTAVS